MAEFWGGKGADNEFSSERTLGKGIWATRPWWGSWLQAAGQRPREVCSVLVRLGLWSWGTRMQCSDGWYLLCAAQPSVRLLFPVLTWVLVSLCLEDQADWQPWPGKQVPGVSQSGSTDTFFCVNTRQDLLLGCHLPSSTSIKGLSLWILISCLGHPLPRMISSGNTYFLQGKAFSHGQQYSFTRDPAEKNHRRDTPT